MKIITIAHQKGGVGKTTLTLNLAAFYALAEGGRIAVLDNDPQGSLAGTADTLQDIDYLPMPSDLSHLRQLTDYDVVLIDTPPYLNRTLVELFCLSDLIVVPTKLGVYDLLAIRSTIELVGQARQTKPDLLATVVLSMVKAVPGPASAEYQALRSFGLPVCETIIKDRLAYSRAALASGVFNSRDALAKQEIQGLGDELLKLMGL